jgi:hypothetical protein
MSSKSISKTSILKFFLRARAICFTQRRGLLRNLFFFFFKKGKSVNYRKKEKKRKEKMGLKKEKDERHWPR